MNGKHHFSFNLYVLIILFAVLWHYLHFSIIYLERCGFWFLVVTLYTNPDSDTPSKPSNNLGIFKYIFLPMEHRGISHNPFAWMLLGLIFGYFGLVPEAIGLFVAAMAHIITDWLSTGVKRVLPKWIWKRVEKVI